MNSRPSSAMGEPYRFSRLRHKALTQVLTCYRPTVEMIQCQWCQAQNQPGTTSCQTCGAPLDERNKVSDSGWREAPRLRDMTEFRFSGSTCQVEGELVPVAEINLHPQDALYFEHHVLLWKDETVPLSSMNTGGCLKRSICAVTHIVICAKCPSRTPSTRRPPR